MAYSTTVDERYVGSYYQYAAGHYDAPSTLNSTFVLKQDGFAYGTLAYNNLLDQDVYSLGVLNSGYYKVDVNDVTWDFGNFDFSSVASFSVLNSYGGVVGTSYGSYTDINFTVNSAETFYVKLTGNFYNSAQYSLTYTKTGEINSPAIFGQSTYSGSASVGNYISVATFNYFDANGNSDNFVFVIWYVDEIYQKITDSVGNFLLLPEYLGKTLSFKLYFYDDLGNYELSNSYVVGEVLGAADTTAPSLSSISPIDGATGVAVGANFVLTFNEAVKVGTGSFVVKSGTTTVANIAATDTSQVSFSGSKITINPTSNLSYSTKYSVSVGAGVIKDAAGNNWVGTGADPYNFTTANKIFNGTNGNDKLNGTSGDDLIYGGSGNDTLNGSTGADLMWGGAGNDIYYVDNASDEPNEAVSASNAADAGGTDLIYSTVSRVLGSYLENLTLVGKSPISGTGNGLNNRITGNQSMNTLAGGLGTDSLYGGADKVKDVFDFNGIAESKNGTATDKVYDFVTKIDKIDLSGIDANTTKTKAGDQAFLFSGTSAKANSIWYKVGDVDGDKKANDLIIYGDVDGNTKADFEIGLVGVTAIAAGDLVL